MSCVLCVVFYITSCSAQSSGTKTAFTQKHSIHTECVKIVLFDISEFLA